MANKPLSEVSQESCSASASLMSCTPLQKKVWTKLLMWTASLSTVPLNENVLGVRREMGWTDISKRKAVVSETRYYNSTTNTNRSQ